MTKLYFSNLHYLFNYFNPKKNRSKLLYEFEYDNIFLMNNLDDRQQSIDEGGSKLNLLFNLQEYENEYEIIPLNIAKELLNSLIKLIIKIFDKQSSNQAITVNLVYIFKVLEAIFSSDIEQLKPNPLVFNIESGLSNEQYLEYSVNAKLNALKILRILITKKTSIIFNI